MTIVPLTPIYPMSNSLAKQVIGTRIEPGHLEYEDPAGVIYVVHQIHTTQFSGDHTPVSIELGERFQSTDNDPGTPQHLHLPSGLGHDGYIVEINQFGTSPLVITGAVNAPGGRSKIAEQYGTGGAIREPDGSWTLSGNITTP